MWNWYEDWLRNRYGNRFRYRNTDRSRHGVRDRVGNWDRHRSLNGNRNMSDYRYRDWLWNADRVGTWDRHRDRNRDVPLDRDWVRLRHRNGNLVRQCEIAGTTSTTGCSSVQDPTACTQTDGRTSYRPKARDPALRVLLLFV
jgi:hypothetical protein